MKEPNLCDSVWCQDGQHEDCSGSNCTCKCHPDNRPATPSQDDLNRVVSSGVAESAAAMCDIAKEKVSDCRCTCHHGYDKCTYSPKLCSCREKKEKEAPKPPEKWEVELRKACYIRPATAEEGNDIYQDIHGKIYRLLATERAAGREEGKCDTFLNSGIIEASVASAESRMLEEAVEVIEGKYIIEGVESHTEALIQSAVNAQLDLILEALNSLKQ